MKKIYTVSVWKWDGDKPYLDENESQFHYIDDNAPMSLMKGGGGGSGNVQNIVKTDPWTGQQPYLAEGFRLASQNFANQDPYFAQFDPATLNAQSGILNAANNNVLSRDAQDMIDKTLRGDYLTGGAGFNAALDAAKNKIIPEVQSTFASRGRTGSGLAQTAEASGIGDAFAKLYEDERQNQLRAGQLAPGIDEMKYAGFDRMSAVGNDRQRLAEYNANARRNQILQYLGAIQGNYGGTTTNSVPDSGMTGWRRYLTGAAGGALAGLPLGPWGAAAGAGLGLLGAYQ